MARIKGFMEAMIQYDKVVQQMHPVARLSMLIDEIFNLEISDEALKDCGPYVDLESVEHVMQSMQIILKGEGIV